MVRQQLDSFNEFVQNSIQEIIDEAPDIVLTPQEQHVPGFKAEERKYRVSFDQIYISKPSMFESTGEAIALFPHEARLSPSGVNPCLETLFLQISGLARSLI